MDDCDYQDCRLRSPATDVDGYRLCVGHASQYRLLMVRWRLSKLSVPQEKPVLPTDLVPVCRHCRRGIWQHIYGNMAIWRHFDGMMLCNPDEDDPAFTGTEAAEPMSLDEYPDPVPPVQQWGTWELGPGGIPNGLHHRFLR